MTNYSKSTHETKWGESGGFAVVRNGDDKEKNRPIFIMESTKV